LLNGVHDDDLQVVPTRKVEIASRPQTAPHCNLDSTQCTLGRAQRCLMIYWGGSGNRIESVVWLVPLLFLVRVSSNQYATAIESTSTCRLLSTADLPPPLSALEVNNAPGRVKPGDINTAPNSDENCKPTTVSTIGVN